MNESFKVEWYVKSKTANKLFGVKHYAGDVIYNSVGFLDKNRDTVQDEVYDLLAKSTVSNPIFEKRPFKKNFTWY